MTREIGFGNLSEAERYYEQYLADPSQVDPSWRTLFSQWEKLPSDAFPSLKEAGAESRGDWRIYDLIHAYRSYGHLLAKVNPIATYEAEVPHELRLETMGFTELDWDEEFPTYGLLSTPRARLRDMVAALQAIYCGRVGIEYMELHSPEMEQWVQSEIEATRFQAELGIEEKRQILHILNKSELFESFLHTKYVGQKRFSLEGGETLIPILQTIIEQSAEKGAETIIMGMAHRGRLNVLCNIMNKSYAEIFSEFEEGYIPDSFEGSGDVKYHKGFQATVTTAQNKKVRIELMPNPSHLESVDPVVEGQVRARQVLLEGDSPKGAWDQVIPLLIHGDASVSGQGVVYETIQLWRLPGYANGGTIHIVINNQIGFTTLPKDARSTLYCTDIARTFDAPVFHVNAEDPEGCVYATKLAVMLRQKFHRDVFIELNCYRKYGHNEGDEPAFTQPLEYQLIRKKASIRELYLEQLIHQGVLEKQLAERMEEEFRSSLQASQDTLKEGKEKTQKTRSSHKHLRTEEQHSELFRIVETGVPAETLRAVAERFCRVPDGLTIHPKLIKLLEERLEMVAAEPSARKPIDWGMAEHLAMATLLWEGVHVRLTGQDSRRGTFSHRHAMWMDQKEARKYFPLSRLRQGQGRFDVFNTPLSEYAALGFEYGYNMANPNAFVIWEAQFGDFGNGAQITIDQYLSTGEQKWGLKVPLTLLLPHGYEGQGPEHSSARMERFLQLCGDDNMFVCNPSTPAQLFHLLRRQVQAGWKKPLIIFTPKGLLRYPECVSTLEDLEKGHFYEVMDDPNPPKTANRMIFCSGRVYYDLINERAKHKRDDLVIVRLEQLYPLPLFRIAELIDRYKEVKQYLWVQEEPSNMGGWKSVRSGIGGLLTGGKNLKYIGRLRSASPAAGSYALHKRQYQAIMEAIF